MKRIPIIALGILALTACQRPQTTNNNIDKSISVGDTIVYEALIHNTETSEPWKNDWLKQLNRNKLVDQLFEAVYSKKVDVVDYDTQQPISVDQVRQWDENNPRSTIGKLQFTETWGWDTKKGKFFKKVIAILPAYEAFGDSGELRGYRVGFQIRIKD